jgi:hypothetical protein
MKKLLLIMLLAASPVWAQYDIRGHTVYETLPGTSYPNYSKPKQFIQESDTQIKVYEYNKYVPTVRENLPSYVIQKPYTPPTIRSRNQENRESSRGIYGLNIGEVE